MRAGCWQCHGTVGQGGAAGPKLAPDPLPFDALSSFVRTTNCQQGVDLATVEDDRFAGEFPGAGFSHHLVEITAGGEEGHIALLHRPHAQKFAATSRASPRSVRSLIDETRCRYRCASDGSGEICELYPQSRPAKDRAKELATIKHDGLPQFNNVCVWRADGTLLRRYSED